MIKKIKDLTWKEVNLFAKNTPNVSSAQYKTCKLISSYTRHNKIDWNSTHKESHSFIHPERLELKVNLATWEQVDEE